MARIIQYTKMKREEALKPDVIQIVVRLRFAGRPSLPLYGKEGGEIINWRHCETRFYWVHPSLRRRRREGCRAKR